MNPIIRVRGLSKRYRIGARRAGYGSLRDSLVSAVSAPLNALRHRRADHPTIWALKDVSFDVMPGEVVGIIGRNGAGKSTLLKILTRITEPTEGEADLYGRVASLLEVGTGFHPELTGRDNIFLNGAILGMRRAEIARKFDEIVAFAEIDQFIDTAVKHYSSGMYMRLAFAVAAHLDPEILLVDEVLAVGDDGFQRKCLGKMDDVARTGRTVLFVSHQLDSVRRLCARTIWFSGGQVREIGPTGDVTTSYRSEQLALRARWSNDGSDLQARPIRLRAINLENTVGPWGATIDIAEEVVVEICYDVLEPVARCQIAVRLSNSQGIPVLTTTDADGLGTTFATRAPGAYLARFSLPRHLLAPGRYSLLVAAHDPGRRMFHSVDDAITFDISGAASLLPSDNRLGVVAPLVPWKTEGSVCS